MIAASPTIHRLFQAASHTSWLKSTPFEKPIEGRSRPIQYWRVKFSGVKTPGYCMTVESASTESGTATLTRKSAVHARVARMRVAPSFATVLLDPLLPEIVTKRFASRRKCMSTQSEIAPMSTMTATMTAAVPFWSL